MLIVVLALVLLERWARRHQRYANDAQHPRPIVPSRLSAPAGAAALLVAATPIAIGFGLPSAYLVHAAAARIETAGAAALDVRGVFGQPCSSRPPRRSWLLRPAL